MKKSICAFLTAIMSLSVLAACNGTSDTDNASAASSRDESSASAVVSAEASETSHDEALPYGYDLPVRDMQGREFRVLCRDYAAGSASIVGYNGEVIQRPDFDEETADMVDIEKYRVRKEIEDKYSCYIEGEFSSASQGDFNNLV